MKPHKGLESKLTGETAQRQLQIIPDTNFFIAYSNNHLWAVNQLQKIKQLAQQEGKQYTIQILEGVLRQYNGFLERETADSYGIKLAHKPLEQYGFVQFGHNTFDIDTPLYGLSQNVWDYDINIEPSSRFSKEEFLRYLEDSLNSAPEAEPLFEKSSVAKRNPLGPGAVDMSVIAASLFLARNMDEVYILSNDFKDIVHRMGRWSSFFDIADFDISVSSQSPIEQAYLRLGNGQAIPLQVTFTGKVLGELMDLETRLSADYPIIIFETGVNSGDATFDVAVGISKKQAFTPFQLPEEYASINDRYALLPLTSIDSFPAEGDKRGEAALTKAMRDLYQRTGTHHQVIFEKQRPTEPLIAHLHGLGTNFCRQFRTDPDFLFYNSDSRYARATYSLTHHQSKR